MVDDGRTTEHGYTISSPCEPDGSGELKIGEKNGNTSHTNLTRHLQKISPQSLNPLFLYGRITASKMSSNMISLKFVIAYVIDVTTKLRTCFYLGYSD